MNILGLFLFVSFFFFFNFPYVFLPEATGGNMGIPLKIAFDQFPHVFSPEATGGNGRQREYRSSCPG